VAHQPLQLRSGEIGIELQARARMDECFTFSGRVLRTNRIATAALPDDSRKERAASSAIKDDDSLTLIRDGKSGNRGDLVPMAGTEARKTVSGVSP